MGKKYDAYEKAAQAETASKSRYQQNPTQQNKDDAIQAERNANLVYDEFTQDPEG